MSYAENTLHRVKTGNHQPLKLRPIRRPRAGNLKVQTEIQKLLDRGLLFNSNSSWSLSMLIVKKKDGTNCIVIDYRHFNNFIKKDNYPLLYIKNALDRLGDARYFSAINLVSGY